MNSSRRFKTVGLLLLASGVLFTPSLRALDAPDAFEKKCSSCHSIGGGDDVGPDLKGVTERRDPKWLVRFIQESQTVIQSGDPVAVELFNKFRQKKMPDQDLSEADVLALLDFIKSGGAGAAKTAESKSALKATPEDIERGRKIFTGEIRLAKGGPACVSCHSAGDTAYLGGGTLGPDLTPAYSNYNDTGLSKVLTKITFPTMAEIYAAKSLTPDEVFQIKAYLYQVDKAGPVTAGYQKKFLFLGVLGLFVGLGVIDFSWRSRRRKSSRPTIGGES